MIVNKKQKCIKKIESLQPGYPMYYTFNTATDYSDLKKLQHEKSSRRIRTILFLQKMRLDNYISCT